MLKDNTKERYRNQLTLYAYNMIKEGIISGEYMPQSKFNQERIAEKLNISRTPVIKALHKLESEGLVDFKAHRGFQVHVITAKELIEIYTLRVAIENMIIKDVIYSASDKELKELDGYFEEFINKNKINVDHYIKADIEFHRRILYLSQNNTALRINSIFEFGNTINRTGLFRSPEKTLAEHIKIINLLQRRDIKGATREACAHFEITRNNIANVIDNLEKEGLKSDNIYARDIIYKIY